MGLNKNEGRKVYLGISDGRVVRQRQAPIEGVTVSRSNKNGKTVHEEFFSSVTALITDIKSKDTPFGKVWEVSLSDGETDFILSWNYSSRYTNNFFRALPNVDTKAPVTINPWSMKDKQNAEKTIIGMSLYQKGADGKNIKIEFAYSKEEPGDMPEMKKKKIKGKEVWDDSDQLEFFEGLAKTFNGSVVATENTNTEALEAAPF